MNEQNKAIIDRARALLASATATPWRKGTGASVVADVPVPEMPGSDELRFYGGHLIGESIVERNADAIVFAVNNIGTLCNALVAAERRAEEAEARDAHNRAEVERVIGPTLAAMKRVGVESLPDATEELIRRLDAVEAERDELATLYRVAEARERRMERELLAVWAAVRPGEPAPLTERDVLHAVEDVQSEAVSLRAIIADCAAAIGNGSGCSKDASVEFMAMIPAEIRADVAALRDRAGIAEGREAAAKANAEQMAGWLDARNAGLVQMARERDALREKLAAAEAKAARMKAPTAKVCRCVNTTYSFDPARAVVLPLAGYSITAGVGCPSCGGSGAVIVETASGE